MNSACFIYLSEFLSRYLQNNSFFHGAKTKVMRPINKTGFSQECADIMVAHAPSSSTAFHEKRNQIL